MTKEQIIELAKQAGFDTINDKVYVFAGQHNISVELQLYTKLVRNAALEQAKQIKWTEIMREGALVTWGDADTLGDRVIEKLESLKEPTP